VTLQHIENWNRTSGPKMPHATSMPHERIKNMPKLSLMLSAACALALTGCAAPQAPYRPPPRPVIDPLPPRLQLTEQDRTLCRKLLQTFSATEQQLQASCHDTPRSSSASKSAGQ
jgi:hypothetical protein